MNTSKPFSTISYNTVGFLHQTLTDLYNRRIITFFSFVYHFHEADEKKDHIHLYVVPNGKINTDRFLELFNEVDPTNPTKPLRCLPCDSSKFPDWFLYCSHDTAYLLSKMQSREFSYAREDFVNSDDMIFNEFIHRIDFSKLLRQQIFVEAASRQEPFANLIAKGVVPIQMTNNYFAAYNMIQGIYPSWSDRNGRSSHTPLEKPHKNIGPDDIPTFEEEPEGGEKPW